MSMKSWGLAGALMALFLAGCSPALPDSTGGPQTQTGTPPSLEVSAYPVPNPSHEVTPQESMEPQPTEESYDPAMQPLVDQAIADLAERQGIDPAEIVVISAEAVVWPDSSLGCPQPDMAYAEVLTPGYLIQLSAEGIVSEYHASRGSTIIYCENPSPPVPGTPADT